MPTDVPNTDVSWFTEPVADGVSHRYRWQYHVVSTTTGTITYAASLVPDGRPGARPCPRRVLPLAGG